MRSSFWLFFAFTGLLSATPLQPPDKRDGGNILVGYRTVSAGEAQAIKNNNNVLTPQVSKQGDINQIGPGKYLGVDPSPWFGDWDCAIYANTNAWNNAFKAWVPEQFGECGKPLWAPNGVQNIPEYLKTLNPNFTPSNTILYSYIDGFTPTNNRNGQVLVQQLIPNSMIKTLGITAACFKQGTDVDAMFKKLPHINWQGFPLLLGNYPAPS